MGWPRYQHVAPDLFDGGVPAVAMEERAPEFASLSRFDDAAWPPTEGWRDVGFGCACPCVLVGQVASLVSLEEEAAAAAKNGGIPAKFGLTKTGVDYCLGALPLGPVSAAAAALVQRATLMDRYGIPGGRAEVAKGCLYPLALAQHAALARAVVARGGARFRWESARLWAARDRPATPEFHVLVVGGHGRVGATSLVRSLVGSELEDDGDGGEGGGESGGGDAAMLRPPGAVAVGTRVVMVPGRPPCTVHFWDLSSSPPDFGVDRPLFARADAVVAVFNPDLRASLDDARDRYDALFGARRGGTSAEDAAIAPARFAAPRLRVLLGNARSTRAKADVCEFFDAVDAVARDRRMKAAVLSVEAPSAVGTKRFLDMVAKALWDGARAPAAATAANAADAPGWAGAKRHLALCAWRPHAGDENAFEACLGTTLADFERDAHGWKWIAVGRDDASREFSVAMLFKDEAHFAEYDRLVLREMPALRHGTCLFAVDAPTRTRLGAAAAPPPQRAGLWLCELEASVDVSALADDLCARLDDAALAAVVSDAFDDSKKLAFGILFETMDKLEAFRATTFADLARDVLPHADFHVDDACELCAYNDDDDARGDFRSP